VYAKGRESAGQEIIAVGIRRRIEVTKAMPRVPASERPFPSSERRWMGIHFCGSAEADTVSLRNTNGDIPKKTALRFEKGMTPHSYGDLRNHTTPLRIWK